MTEEEFAALSDEEISRMSAPPEITGSSAPQPDEEPQDDPADADAAAGDPVEAGSPDPAAGPDESLDPGEDDAAGNPAPGAAEGPTEAGADGRTQAAPQPGDDAAQPAADAAPVEIDYKAVYEKVMAPFKANGKEIKLQSPDEVVQLMQMGANYTKKLQALQPNLKLLKMLENNGLLDETKLNYLIDIDRKNPAAIQKLVRDSGIDPMEIDTQSDPGYRPGNHGVSDAEMRFTTTLDEIVSTQHGQSLVVDINKTWDAQSKDALWNDPEVLRVLTEQKESGTFDAIKAEVDRRKMLGYIGNVPFLQAYLAVGREMQDQGHLTQPQRATGGSNQIPGSQTGRVVDTRVATRKPSAVVNNDKARAASPVRTQPVQAASEINFLAMSDEDFAKHAELMKRL